MISECAGKKAHKEKEIALSVSDTLSTPPASDSTLAVDLDEEVRKYLKQVIFEAGMGRGTVWRMHFPKEYPDSLRLHLSGFTKMQVNLNSTLAKRVSYSHEAFQVTSMAEERKVIEEDPQGTLDFLLYYQHHLGITVGALKDKYENETLQLEAPVPTVPQSKAAIIENDFFKEQA